MSWQLAPAKFRHLGTVLIVLAVVLPVAAVLLWASLWEAPVVPGMDYEVPIARFLMGSPNGEEGRNDDETQHEVILTRPFVLADTEVTQEQYRVVMGLKKSDLLEKVTTGSCRWVEAGDDLPMVCVSWNDAVEYCNRLSSQESLVPAYEKTGEIWKWHLDASGYRLPTEAEWEYAARAGAKWKWVGTQDEDEICRYANVRDASFEKVEDLELPPTQGASCNDGYPSLSSVFAHEPNAWGFYGMGGNVAEWVWDIYGGDFQVWTATDPRGAREFSNRVLRGGSWANGPINSRAAVRSSWPPSIRSPFLGFRVARSLPNPSALGPSDPRRPPGLLRDGSASEAARAGEARPGAASRGLPVGEGGE